MNRPPSGLYQRPISSTTSLEVSPNKQAIDRLQFLLQPGASSKRRLKKEIVKHITNTCPNTSRSLLPVETNSSRSEQNSNEEFSKNDKKGKSRGKSKSRKLDKSEKLSLKTPTRNDDNEISKPSTKTRNPSGPERGRDKFKKMVGKTMGRAKSATRALSQSRKKRSATTGLFNENVTRIAKTGVKRPF